LGQILGVAALSLLFAHFGWIYGAFFASSSALLYILFLYLAHHPDDDSPTRSNDNEAA
jgi:hypothetical protein